MNTPDPNAGIPVGLATKLGQIAIAVFAIIGIVTAILHGDHSSETLMSFGGAIATLVTLMGGRYLQAAAKYVNVTPTADVVEEDDPDEDYDFDAEGEDPSGEEFVPEDHSQEPVALNAEGVASEADEGNEPEGAISDKPGEGA